MDQKITIKIAGHDYILKADTPEREELIRLAAIAVNKGLSEYTKSYPGKNVADLLSLVALTECVSRLSIQRKLDDFQSDAQKLKHDTDTYLEQLT